MKTTGSEPQLAGLLTRFTLVIAMSFFTLFCTAQNVWEAPEVRAEKTVFICDNLGSRICIENSNFIDPSKTKIEYNWDDWDYAFVELCSQDTLREAFKESFTGSRLKQLAEKNDYVIMIFHVDGKGQILGITFLLNKWTSITPEEMETLEQELLSRVRFVPVGKKIDDTFFHRITFIMFFAKILDH